MSGDRSLASPPAQLWNIFGLIEALCVMPAPSEADERIVRWLGALRQEDDPSPIVSTLEHVTAAILYLEHVLKDWPATATGRARNPRAIFQLGRTSIRRDVDPNLWVIHQTLTTVATIVAVVGFDEAEAYDTVSATVRWWSPAERAAVRLAIPPLRAMVSLIMSKVVY